jgi:DNA-binding transcriptional ArsR family regulator
MRELPPQPRPPAAPVIVLVIVAVAVIVAVRLTGVRAGIAHGVTPSGLGRPLDFVSLPHHYVRMNARMHLSGAHDAQQPADREQLAAAVEVLGLLADRTRLALLWRLGEGEADVTTLTSSCGATRTSVSQHLARLRLAGLVTTRKEGRRVVYSLRHGHLRRLVDEALNVADHQIRHLPPHD